MTSMVLLLFARGMGMVALLPLGQGVFAVPNRMILALALTLGFLPSLPGGIFPLSWLVLLAEFFIGFILALPFVLLFDCARMLGQLFDTGRGQNIAQMYDPTAQFPETTSSVFAKHFAWCSVVFSGGLLSLYLAFGKSVDTLPIGSGWDNIVGSDWGEAILHLCQFWRVGLLASLPILFVFLLVDAALAFFAKSLPQVMLHAEVFMVKSYVGTLALLLMVDARAQMVFDALVNGELFQLSWFGTGSF